MWDLGILFIPPLEEDHIPKLLKKKIQKERVENVMKNGGQRIAIDFTLSEDMSNKVSTFSFQFCKKPKLLFFFGFVCLFFGWAWRILWNFLWRSLIIFTWKYFAKRFDPSFFLLHLSKNLDVANPVGNAHTGQHSKYNLMFYALNSHLLRLKRRGLRKKLPKMIKNWFFSKSDSPSTIIMSFSSIHPLVFWAAMSWNLVRKTLNTSQIQHFSCRTERFRDK